MQIYCIPHKKPTVDKFPPASQNHISPKHPQNPSGTNQNLTRNRSSFHPLFDANIGYI